MDLTTRSQQAVSTAVQHRRRARQSRRRAGAPGRRPARRRRGTDPAAATGRRRRSVGGPGRRAAAGRRPAVGAAALRSARRRLSRAFLAVLSAAEREARDRGDEYVSTEHLLIALAQQGGDVATLLQQHGATAQALADALQAVRGSARVTSPDPEGTFQALEKYGVDLTAARPRGQDRPGHRPRRRDPPRDPGALAAAPRTTRC